MQERAFPRDPERLLREVDASIRIREIEEWQRLKENVSIQWWESALVALLFISGIGIIVTIAKLIPDVPAILYYFILAWSILWILTLISCVEFLLLKFRALRRMHEIIDLRLRRIEQALDPRQKQAGPEAHSQDAGDSSDPEGAQPS